ncbi:MAG TPA: HypC/HybG/HupF family hydrogenase formation chaperone [Solirubrobacteraceae bacterium]|nr:HypC/HybG/HupF family hydrogenase formation chaperone [Solirubrobacteraceae bacterium]
MTDACHAEHCITCGDEGIELRVTAGAGPDGLAPCVAADGARADVDVLLVEPVEPGELLLVHAGVAIGRVREEAA